MSRGKSQMRTHSAGTALKRCCDRSHSNTIIVDVDIGAILVDSPESSHCKSRCSEDTKGKHVPAVVCIEDDDDSDDDMSSKSFHSLSSSSYEYEDIGSDECQFLNTKGGSGRFPKQMFGMFSSECSTSKTAAHKHGILDSTDFRDDLSDCEIIDDSSVDIRKKWEKAALKKKMEKRTSDPKKSSSAFWTKMTRNPLCERACSNVFIRTNYDAGIFQDEDGIHSDVNASIGRTDKLLSSSDKSNDPRKTYSTKFKREDSVKASDHVVGDDNFWNCDFDYRDTTPGEKSSPPKCRYRKDVFDHGGGIGQGEQLQNSIYSHIVCMQKVSTDCESNEKASISRTELEGDNQFEGLLRSKRLSPSSIPCSSLGVYCPEKGNIDHTERIMNPVTALPTDVNSMCAVSESKKDVIGDREKFKESDEYRRAEEEEWASRKRELLIQSEEAQRLRKKKKAEVLRLQDMERRQKQRLIEIRESQKRDKETLTLKEQIRVEIQEELEKLEMKYRDMASLLRGLGISIPGDPYPLPHEVNAAYKQALVRFHPDRASRVDIRQQVEAEEKFKLISRLREKLLPVAH